MTSPISSWPTSTSIGSALETQSADHQRPGLRLGHRGRLKRRHVSVGKVREHAVDAVPEVVLDLVLAVGETVAAAVGVVAKGERVHQQAGGVRILDHAGDADDLPVAGVDDAIAVSVHVVIHRRGGDAGRINRLPERVPAAFANQGPGQSRSAGRSRP